MRKKTKQQPVDDVDRLFLDSISAGSTSAFDELVQKYEGKLYNFGLKICKDVGDAEDLVQETFINVFKSINSFRHETKFKNWLYKIAANACWKMRRKSKFAPDRELPLEDFMPAEHSEIDKKPPAWASAPVDQLLNNELSLKIKKGIDALPDRYKLVLVLRDMEGFSTEETAKILSITIQNVKVRLHRARLFLREELKDYYAKN